MDTGGPFYIKDLYSGICGRPRTGALRIPRKYWSSRKSEDGRVLSDREEYFITDNVNNHQHSDNKYHPDFYWFYYYFSLANDMSLNSLPPE